MGTMKLSLSSGKKYPTHKTVGEENEAVKKKEFKNQEEFKNELFAKLSKDSGKCIKSTTREMMGKDVSWKGVRCSVSSVLCL
jgi:hypothetical protein